MKEESNLVAYLITAISALAATCGALFWQLQKAKEELTDTLRELLPVTIQVTKAVEALERQSEKLESEVRKNVTD